LRTVFLDSNILIYVLAEGDPRQAVAAKQLAQGFVASVQVLNEFANVARRKLGLPWPDVTAALSALRVFCPAPVPLTVATHEAALLLAARLGFSFYDSLIVASALEAGCTTLLSEDMQDSRVVDGRLTIRNPFRQG